ncbi:class I SAM-dependent methyltransferase [Algoriphagus machipongonensis]|uniref:Methyltransferase n=1 Tax=Algoriphagus machipongonensis TaxID=388413 RepID=A3HU08_9BACT|nr:class I SAM-dependent methyltransferase [Algoriphagus machipongonensis]EAZ81630.1 methyltransferase [Algoriphagus machipongonensis]
MSFITELFAASDNPNSLGAKLRNKRQKAFEKLFFSTFPDKKPIKILDLGGTAYFWKNSFLLDLPYVEITLLNLTKEEENLPKIKSVCGDATNMPEYQDQSFDLIFSNSVIEHLYNWENQVKMAEEIKRVGKKYFIQTPNKYFPIEAHYAIPFAQFAPKSLIFKTLTKTKLSRLKKWDEADAKQYLEEIVLLSEGDMRKLFEGASIYKEKMFGLTKSLTAHNLG